MPIPALGAVLMALGVLCGAFGAHGLEGRVTPERMEAWNTGALYHLVNAVGLLAVAGLCERAPERVSRAAILLLVAGILVFSGSLYLLVLLDMGWLGAITPLGGISLVVAWLWIGLGEVFGKRTGSSKTTQ